VIEASKNAWSKSLAWDDLSYKESWPRESLQKIRNYEMCFQGCNGRVPERTRSCLQMNLDSILRTFTDRHCLVARNLMPPHCLFSHGKLFPEKAVSVRSDFSFTIKDGFGWESLQAKWAHSKLLRRKMGITSPLRPFDLLILLKQAWGFAGWQHCASGVERILEEQHYCSRKNLAA